ncbi:hypothetical protein EDD17DRAFT_1634693 [Pisolithus thermaeus]|nr:hypothetical protein EDD17DRAFT_1634693 [Pisolithus thermaeus]
MTRVQRPVANLKPVRLQNSGSYPPVFESRTTSAPPVLPHIDTDPSIKQLPLPDERSLSDMRLPPIELVDPTICMPYLLGSVEERHNSSESIVREASTISMVSQAPSVSTTNLWLFCYRGKKWAFHDTHYDMQCTTDTRGVGYRLSTDSRASSMNVPFSGYQHHFDGDTVEIGKQSRQSSLSHPTACAPTNVRTALPTQSSRPQSEKGRSKAAPTPFSPFRRIRRYLTPSGDQLPLTQRAVLIAPAKCAEPVVVAPTGDCSRPTNPSSSPGEVIPSLDDGQSTIATSEDGATGCCIFCG